ncbi:hypothetical protein pb186bvf_018681 [Paramecium bursaria]
MLCINFKDLKLNYLFLQICNNSSQVFKLFFSSLYKPLRNISLLQFDRSISQVEFQSFILNELKGNVSQQQIKSTLIDLIIFSMVSNPILQFPYIFINIILDSQPQNYINLF